MYFMHTARLAFRTWQEGDLDLALGLWGDAGVTRLIGGPFSRQQVLDRLTREIANLNAYRVQYWPIFLRASDGHVDEHVGCCGLRPYKLDQDIYEIGFRLRTAYWGQGLAQEAACAVMAYAFDTLGATALFAGHHPANQASRHALEKLGFRYTHDEFYAPTQLQHPSYLLRAEEYAQRVT